MIFKSAYLNVKSMSEKEPFFSEELPENFEDIKMYF